MTITERICFLCENRQGHYSFSIRSMQEYFAGRNALLFALGYIELQRKSLEPEIGRLCEQMNGKDNIITADYDLENLCLFGSWLAIDILAEDIFRGKQQDKYIVLVAKVLEMADCDKVDKFNNFSLITGVQKDKLLSFIREHYFQKGEFQEKILKLYLKLNENDKNSLDTEIMHMEEILSEEQQLMFAIHVLEKGIRISKEVRRIANERIEKALRQDKVKFFLPESVLIELLNTVKTGQSITLKKNLFLQYLYSDSTYLSTEKIHHQIGVDIVTATLCLRPFSPIGYRCCNRIKISELMDISIRDEGANKKDLEILQTQLQKMNLNFLANFCNLLLEPSFGKYQELYNQLDKEEKYLCNIYKFVFKDYIGNAAFGTEEEFDEWILMREADYEKIIGGDVKGLQCREMRIKFLTTLVWNNCIIEDLIEEGTICFGELSVLNEQFLMFACLL